MSQTANSIAIHAGRRFSPYAFNPNRSVSAADVEALFEAARWAPSAYNAQPWRYIVGAKGRNPDVWQKIFDALVPANQAWAQHAPVLALGLIQPLFEHNGAQNPMAEHDLGAASAELTREAHQRGIGVHQMSGFDASKAAETFDLTDHYALTAMAIGYAASEGVDAQWLERDAKPRSRKDVHELIIAGGF